MFDHNKIPAFALQFLKDAAAQLDLDIVGKGFIDSMRTSHEAAKNNLSDALAKQISVGEELGLRVSMLLEFVQKAHALLSGAGVPEMAAEAASDRVLTLAERIALLLASPPGDRDFAWALAEVHAGRIVTHPLISSTRKKGQLSLYGMIEKGDVKTPVYRLDIGGPVYEKVYPEDAVFTELAVHATGSHGWEIYQEDALNKRRL